MRGSVLMGPPKISCSATDAEKAPVESREPDMSHRPGRMRSGTIHLHTDPTPATARSHDEQECCLDPAGSRSPGWEVRPPLPRTASETVLRQTILLVLPISKSEQAVSRGRGTTAGPEFRTRCRPLVVCVRKRGPALWCGAWLVLSGLCGGVLLSHPLAWAVPSACGGLTSGFGMGPGVSLQPWPPAQDYGTTPGVGGLCCQATTSGGGVVRGFWTSTPWGGVVVQSRTVDMRDHLQIVVRASPRPISTGQLRTLQCVHVRPINPMVYRGPYQIHLWEPSS